MKRYHSIIDSIPTVLQGILNTALVVLAIVLSVLLFSEAITFTKTVFWDNKAVTYWLVETIIVFFLYFEFIALIVKYFTSNYHFPLRYIIYIGITALVRLIIVSHDKPFETLLYAGSILILVVTLYIANLRKLEE